MAWGELLDFIELDFLPQAEAYQGSYEEYLRSLLGVVTGYKGREGDSKVLTEVLMASLVAEPLRFDSRWPAYTSPPSSRRSKEPPYHIIMDDYEFMLRTVFFQISEMRTPHPQEYDYSDIWTSATGHRWYNFTMLCVFRSATSGLRLHNSTPCDWTILANLLEVGRVYE